MRKRGRQRKVCKNSSELRSEKNPLKLLMTFAENKKIKERIKKCEIKLK